MRYPYAQQGQQTPANYWEGYQGYGGNPAVPPVPSQQMPGMASQHDQWSRGQQELMVSVACIQLLSIIPIFQNIIKQHEASLHECKNRLTHIYNLPRSPTGEAEVAQLQQKMVALNNDLNGYKQQLQYHMSAAAQHQAQVPPTSQAAMPQAHMTPNPGVPPVHVNQTGNQVQLNITAADKSRTLISVYHEGYNGSGASSTESKESIVPPEPTPSTQQQPPPEPVQQQQPPQQQVPQVKMEEKEAYQQQPPPSYNGIENGVSAGNPYQQQQQQMYGQYQNQHPQQQNVSCYLLSVPILILNVSDDWLSSTPSATATPTVPTAATAEHASATSLWLWNRHLL